MSAGPSPLAIWTVEEKTVKDALTTLRQLAAGLADAVTLIETQAPQPGGLPVGGEIELEMDLPSGPRRRILVRRIK